MDSSVLAYFVALLFLYQDEVDSFLQYHQLQMEGSFIPRPIQTFDELVVPGMYLLIVLLGALGLLSIASITIIRSIGKNTRRYFQEMCFLEISTCSLTILL